MPRIDFNVTFLIMPLMLASYVLVIARAAFLTAVRWPAIALKGRIALLSTIFTGNLITMILASICPYFKFPSLRSYHASGQLYAFGKAFGITKDWAMLFYSLLVPFLIFSNAQLPTKNLVAWLMFALSYILYGITAVVYYFNCLGCIRRIDNGWSYFLPDSKPFREFRAYLSITSMCLLLINSLVVWVRYRNDKSATRNLGYRKVIYSLVFMATVEIVLGVYTRLGFITGYPKGSDSFFVFMDRAICAVCELEAMGYIYFECELGQGLLSMSARDVLQDAEMVNVLRGYLLRRGEREALSAMHEWRALNKEEPNSEAEKTMLRIEKDLEIFIPELMMSQKAQEIVELKRLRGSMGEVLQHH